MRLRNPQICMLERYQGSETEAGSVLIVYVDLILQLR